MLEFENIKFPDGQINTAETTAGGGNFPRNVHFKFAINSYEDLFRLASYAEMRKHNDLNLPCVFIPCLFGQRSDRRFAENEGFGLKVITDFINSMDLQSVGILDPHSDVSLALLDRSFKVSPEPYIKQACRNIAHAGGGYETVLVSPDAGAYKKVYGLADKMNLELVAANKFREHGEGGNLFINVSGDVKDKDCLIVDDLADGGYTFYQLGKKLRDMNARRVFLYVSHGYFNRGFETLKTALDGIFTTDSIKEIKNPLVTQYHLPDYISGEML